MCELAEIFTPLPARLRMECEFCGPGECMGHYFPDTGEPLPDLLTPDEAARVLRLNGKNRAAQLKRLIDGEGKANRGRLRAVTGGNKGGGVRRMIRRDHLLAYIYKGCSDPAAWLDD